MKKLHIVLLVVLILAFAAVLTTGIILDNREKSNQRKYYSAEIGGKKYKQKSLYSKAFNYGCFPSFFPAANPQV